ncbi:hypothetical protein ACFLX0_00500 [Chloroflexota bacterium]
MTFLGSIRDDTSPFRKACLRAAASVKARENERDLIMVLRLIK